MQRLHHGRAGLVGLARKLAAWLLHRGAVWRRTGQVFALVLVCRYWLARGGRCGRSPPPVPNANRRVCVVGGGIAGTSAAWSLRRAGFAVELFEKKPTLGGNAKSHVWNVPSASGGTTKVRTGLSVLAWPKQLFHTYNALLGELGIDTVSHVLRFFVGSRRANATHSASTAAGDAGGEGAVQVVYAHGRASHTDSALQRHQLWLAHDLQRWRRMAGFVRWLNSILQPPPLGPGTKSVYRNSLLNPLNLIPLRRLAWLFGVSQRFWYVFAIAPLSRCLP